jgi:thioredoxin-like negative regulator of GroEL
MPLALHTMLDRKTLDFLYWHAVTKMRMAEFEKAAKLFDLLHQALPQSSEVVLGRAYCLMRVGDFDSASKLVHVLRRHPVKLDEMALLGRLHRRCDFEKARARKTRTSPVPLGVVMPHSMGDDDMARRAWEH